MRVLRAVTYELFFLGFFLVALPLCLTRFDPFLPASVLGPLRLPGAVLILGGLALSEYCLGLLLRHGHGLQAPFDQPTVLVHTGPYCRVRNPMALGFIAMLLGVALLFTSTLLLLYALLMGSVVHALIVLREEPALHRRFGRRWEGYAREVPRWIPRVGGGLKFSP